MIIDRLGGRAVGSRSEPDARVAALVARYSSTVSVTYEGSPTSKGYQLSPVGGTQTANGTEAEASVERVGEGQRRRGREREERVSR